MSARQRMVWYVVLLVAGLALVVAGVAGFLDNYWSGMGGALAAVAVIRIVGTVRLLRDSDLERRMQDARTDERNVFIAASASRYALTISIALLAVGGVILRPMGFPDVASVLIVVMALETAAYLVSYVVCSRRY